MSGTTEPANLCVFWPSIIFFTSNSILTIQWNIHVYIILCSKYLIKRFHLVSILFILLINNGKIQYN